MTDDISLTEEERLRDQARIDIVTPPMPIPGAENLPDEVRDGRVPEDAGSTVDHHEGD